MSYRRAQEQQVSPWWIKGPSGYKRAQLRIISLWWTKGPVGYNGAQKWETARKRGKIVSKRVLHRKIVDRCLERLQ